MFLGLIFEVFKELEKSNEIKMLISKTENRIVLKDSCVFQIDIALDRFQRFWWIAGSDKTYIANLKKTLHYLAPFENNQGEFKLNEIRIISLNVFYATFQCIYHKRMTRHLFDFLKT